MNHYLEFKGTKMVKYNIGEIKHTSATHDVIVIKAINTRIETKEKHFLTLNKQEDTL
ncbi:hypothetical protein [Flavobacterium taihuense]|uniref:Uncharacterized protein n=1 Tax=Flavobacterium taihuense TaxID=2857508 RepID=A0ABS6XUM1_9FLAO|nr:hypothetical protein [Flavobacterium taihuense]MBW4359956.1 hypothetical protein [Flavobacterium taihuense]